MQAMACSLSCVNGGMIGTHSSSRRLLTQPAQSHSAAPAAAGRRALICGPQQQQPQPQRQQGVRCCSTSSNAQQWSQQQQQQLCRAPLPAAAAAQRAALGRRSSVATAAAPAAAAAESLSSVEELVGPDKLEAEVFEIVTYALKLAWTAETYYVHSWMLLLGLLKNEKCTACQVLRELGLDDLYGAWNEVLWALNVADGLTPRAFAPRMTWGERASAILQGAVRYGGWAGRDRVTSADLLMAVAASGVLGMLFPDVDLSFERVRKAVERASGAKYVIPGLDDGPDTEGSVLTSQDNFL